MTHIEQLIKDLQGMVNNKSKTTIPVYIEKEKAREYGLTTIFGIAAFPSNLVLKTQIKVAKNSKISKNIVEIAPEIYVVGSESNDAIQVIKNMQEVIDYIDSTYSEV